MDNFLRYFYQDIGRVFRAFLEIFNAFFNFLNYLLNFPMRMEIIKAYESEFTTGDWIMLLVANLALLGLCGVLVFFLVKGIRKMLRFRIPVQEYDAMVKQVKSLQRDLLRANYEKDKLMAMKMGSADPLQDSIDEGPEEDAVPEDEDTLPPDDEEEYVPSSNRNTFDSPCVDPADSRFFRLTTVDNYYKTQYIAPVYNNTITLEQFCDQFQSIGI